MTLAARLVETIFFNVDMRFSSAFSLVTWRVAAL